VITMKTTLVHTRVLLALCSMAVAVEAQLENGGADTGDLSSWTSVAGSIDASTSQVQGGAPTVTPQAGTHFFNFHEAGVALGAIKQAGVCGFVPGQPLTLSGFVQTEPTASPSEDFGEAIVRVFDGSGSIVGSATSGALTSPSGVWSSFSVPLATPANAISWEVELQGTLLFGTKINVFFDTLQLDGAGAPAPVAAEELIRAGTPPNPVAFLPGVTSAPVIGSTWDPSVDHTTFEPCSIGDFMVLSPSPTEVDLGFPGTLLCNLPFVATLFDIPPSPTFDIPIPDDCGLVGIALCAQVGSSCDGVSFALSNALDIVIGAF